MAKILRQTTVIRDGMHNAFTDLLYWQGCYWVGYRKGHDHVSMDAEAVLAVTVERQRFREVAHIKMPGDVRDPKLLAMADGRMAMFIPSWIGGYQKRQLQQYVAFSSDGFNWGAPVPILATNYWLWRVAAFGGRYYGACYSFPADRQSPKEYVTELMVSDDMINWQTLGRIGDETMSLGETGMHFFPDGELWTVTRRNRDPHTSVFGLARPPYTHFETTDLGVLIHAPVIVENKGSLYVAGRRDAVREGETTYPFPSQFSLGVWRLEKGKVTPVLHIPAAGDCSYPGMIKDPDGRICMTYYSQHAYMTGVVEPTYIRDNEAPYNTARVLVPSDVYFAELSLD